MLVRRLRRRRRGLRLPLGVLPLVLLLLLAVQRLARAVYQPQQHVMQVSMPILWAQALVYMQKAHEQGLPAMVWALPPELDRRRRWQFYSLIGNARHDAAMLRAVADRLRRGQTHPAEQADICIRFGSGTRYAQVVAALDVMLQVGHPKYALDLYRPDPVLYVFVTPGRLW